MNERHAEIEGMTCEGEDEGEYEDLEDSCKRCIR